MTLNKMALDTLTNDSGAGQKIIDRVQAAGIVGLGGGAYPTATKLANARQAKALIINGLQSEPDNHSDLALLQECTADVLIGIRLVATVCAAPTVVLALPDTITRSLRNDLDAALAVEASWLAEHSIHDRVDLRQVLLRADHASGEEHQLAHRLGFIETLSPSVQAAPLTDQDILCINLATSYAIARAVVHGEVLERRQVSVNGEPRWLQLGTPIASLVQPGWVNGRQSGAAAAAEAVVGAGTFCITTPPPAPTAPCINCGACAPVCPAQLQPQELFACIELDASPPEHLQLEACLECGACNAVCPSNLWLTQAFRAAKEQAMLTREREIQAAKAKTRVDARTQRLERIANERVERLSNRSESRRRSW